MGLTLEPNEAFCAGSNIFRFLWSEYARTS